jgi:hypothetical protein
MVSCGSERSPFAKSGAIVLRAKDTRSWGMSAENTPTNMKFYGRGAGPSRQARIVSVASLSPAGQTIVRRAGLTRVLD